jgi:hypothetical protein
LTGASKPISLLPPGSQAGTARTQRTVLDANPADTFVLFFGVLADARQTPSGEGGKMSTKRTILLAAGSLLTAFLSTADPGNRAVGCRVGHRPS